MRALTASHAFSPSETCTHRPSGPPFTTRLPASAPNTFHGGPRSKVKKLARKATGSLSASGEGSGGGASTFAGGGVYVDPT